MSLKKSSQHGLIADVRSIPVLDLFSEMIVRKSAVFFFALLLTMTLPTSAIASINKPLDKTAQKALKDRIDELRDDVIYTGTLLEDAKRDAAKVAKVGLLAKKTLQLAEIRYERSSVRKTQKDVDRAKLQWHLAQRSIKTQNHRVISINSRFQTIQKQLKSAIETLVYYRNASRSSEKAKRRTASKPKQTNKMREDTKRSEYQALLTEARKRIKTKKALEAEFRKLNIKWHASGHTDMDTAERLQVVKSKLMTLNSAHSPLLEKVNNKMIESSFSFSQR